MSKLLDASVIPSKFYKQLKQPKPVVVDFETEGIEGRPNYPPKPVGVSIKYPGEKARYYAWGHPTNNNCNRGLAANALKKAWRWAQGLLFQNAKFDIDVAEAHFGLPIPSWDKIHDTLFLLFLDDPHQAELSLKPSSERLLDMPPEEQDAVADWLLEHQPLKEQGIKISKARNSEHYFGRYICLAPGDIVGEYANGDTIRTEKLFNLLWKKTKARGMLGAYDRERMLMPDLLDMERQGLPVDLQRLQKDVKLYQQWFDDINVWVIKRLKASADLNLDSGEQLVEAMLKAKVADPRKMPRTPTGKYQTNKEALLMGVTDKVLLAVLKYRTQLKTCLNTFMVPWLKTARAAKGKHGVPLIFTTWNQTKTPSGDSNVGTRTGRLSSTPNFQNMPLMFKPIFKRDEEDKVKRRLLPDCPWKALPPLPRCRSYIVPFVGEILIDRDYSQQEPRILAHFDGGQLLETYLKNPWVDFHDFAQQELAKMGLHYGRKQVKNTNLGIIYGMGIGLLAERNGQTVEEAKQLKAALLKLYPGLKAMYGEMKYRMQANLPIRTWGGREYYCEPAKIIDGRLRTFDYKMVNILIQGSAADCTKEAVIRFYRAKRPHWRLLLNVHDQLTASVPKSEALEAMRVLKECMESVEFEVPMLSEGAVSETNWAELKDLDKKGVVIDLQQRRLTKFERKAA